VAVVGKLVQKQDRDCYIYRRRNNAQNIKTQNTQNREQTHKARQQTHTKKLKNE
jgi:hypothetical protein